ncbi:MULTISPECIES: hypothetical protein [Mycobacteriales]|uniref:Phage integrase family protein n=3 Tax=Mycobacteriales TaxID=85007 RepID=A0A846WT38_9ACTN|nr:MULTISPECIES: hypothetical protein [Mycobacteriales]NKY04784.1 hypothetical protein [Gordonia polyisoprenivorans]NKY20452.1 hypothetical protein [Tsukamurella spumae]QUD82663.1 hypothetical protein J8M97_23770 [Gordonia polyisoprenivorans]
MGDALMVRYKAHRAQLALPGIAPEPDDLPDSVVGPRTIGRFTGDPRGWVPAGQEERFERLSKATSTVGNPDLRESAARIGAALVCRLKEGTEANDMSHVQHVIRFIAGYVEPPLPIDVQSVFRRSVVDGYINHLIATGRERGARQNQYLYYAVGRLVHPREYPLSRAASKKPKRRTAAPASDTLIADWYRTAASLSGEQQRRAYVSLDLALGAGVRQGELSRVRGTSISSTTYFGREHAVVTLPNRAGGVRHVPVVDVARSERILQRAKEVGDASMMTPGIGPTDRNFGNRLNEYLRRHGHTSIDLLAARERWIHDLAKTVPACLMVQLADVSTFASIKDHRPSFPIYGIRATLVALDGRGVPA